MNTPETEFDNDRAEYQEEWLSAYLDEELTPDQRAIVEQRLATDPAAKQLLEDLERIRGLVVGLPAWPATSKAIHWQDLRNAKLDDATESPELEAPHSGASEATHVLTMDSDAVERSLQNSDIEPSQPFQSSAAKGGMPGWKALAVAAGFLGMVGVGVALWRSDSTPTTLADASRAEPAMEASDSQPDTALMFPSLEPSTEGEKLGSGRGVSASSSELLDRGSSVASLPQADEPSGTERFLPTPPASSITASSPSQRALPAPEIGPNRGGLGMPPPPLEKAGRPADVAEPAEPLPNRSDFPLAAADKNDSFGIQDSLAASGSLQPVPAASDRTLWVARSSEWSAAESQAALPAVAASLGAAVANLGPGTYSAGEPKRPTLIGGGYPLAMATIQAAEGAEHVVARLLEPQPQITWFSTSAEEAVGARPSQEGAAARSESALSETELPQMKSEPNPLADLPAIESAVAGQEFGDANQLRPPSSAIAGGALGALPSKVISVALFLQRSEAEDVLSRARSLGLSQASPLWITRATPDAMAGSPREKVILILNVAPSESHPR